MSAFCLEHGLRLLAYGALAGGFLTERWLHCPEPAGEEIADWSNMKYKRFVAAAGGWQGLQAILAALDKVAQRHAVSIANVATRWTLEHPAVAAVIVGAWLGERRHTDDNVEVFSFALDAKDRALIDEALANTTPLGGDCGDEYRKAPFLTASGDLSHHLEATPRMYEAAGVDGRRGRLRVSSGAAFEPIAGYSRAVRVGDQVLVSGTTATNVPDEIVAEAIARAHGRYFGSTRPANTMLEIARLIGDYEVEIEAEAVID
jgi:enamine deaminase RidA (YjgF/YER057c/UK114 family)